MKTPLNYFSNLQPDQRIIITALTLLLMNAPALVECANAQTFPPSGLVSWWPGDGDAKDIFGGNPGLPVNGASFASGKCGGAFKFDGVDDVVKSASASLTDLANSFTLEFWVWPTASRTATVESTTGTAGTSGQRYAIAPENGGSAGPAGAGVSVGTNGISVFEHAASYLPSLLVYTNSITNWTHVAVVYQNKQPSLFVNGALVRTGLPSSRTSVFPSKTFGNVLGYGPFKGSLDEVSIYNRALSAAEILAIYTAGSAGKCKPSVPLSSTIIYTNDFEGPIGDEWSAPDLDITPVGDRMYLGQFGSQTVTLTLSNLPPHTNLSIAFDLNIMKSWDGNNGGPDYWDFGLYGQPALLHTTFQLQSPAGRQSYPEQYGLGDYQSRMGAMENDTLGYSVNSSPRDSVYHMSFTLNHTNDTVKFQFKGSGLGTLTDESWGLDDLAVIADAPVVSLNSPTNGEFVSPSTNLMLVADAHATTGTISQVMFLDNSVLLGIVTNSPFSVIWSNVPGGVHVVTAKATDTAGRTSQSSATIKIGGLLGEYFTNTSLVGISFQRIDPVVNFNWEGSKPIPNKVGNFFSAKWTGVIQPKYSEFYTFTTDTDDGTRLWIDGERVIDEWHGQTSPNSAHSATVLLEAGRKYDVCMTYFNYKCCGAWANLFWSSPSQADEIIPSSQLSPPVRDFNYPPHTPVVNNPAADGDVVNPQDDLQMSVDFFSDPDTLQTQAAADWEIYTINPSSLVWFSHGTAGANLLTNHLSNGIFTNSHAGLTRLLSNRDYVLCVRHQDNSGATNSWSKWGERAFNTRPPAITAQPHFTALYQDNPIILGADVVLSVMATNISPVVIFQWRFNNTDIPYSTNATLTLTNIQANQAGNYTVRVSNLAGNVVSLPLALLVDANFGALAQSTFENSNEGWTVFGDPVSTIPVLKTNGGSPRGYIQTTDQGNGSYMYWSAPASFLGNKSGAYGGILEFDLIQSTTTYQDHGGNVILSGSGLNLFFDAGYNPSTSWTSYNVPLDELWWRKDSAFGPPATQLDLLKALSSLDGLRIRAEFSGAGDTDGLDNVRFLAPNCTPATILVTRQPTSGVMLIEWPANACGFQLELTDGLKGSSWAETSLPINTTNGLKTIALQQTNACMFFRLKRAN